jgi:cyclopropane fatty-acyl-phospholipid synthase-like methyltransferase
MYSKKLSQYYNDLMGDYSSIVNCTHLILSKYVPKGSSLLEIGCGTGNILKSLEDTYDVAGLDIAPAMLAQAKKQLPKVPLYNEDMRSFRINKQYDAILCIFDSINHLTKFSDWKKTFAQVDKHLQKDGTFIFDMNTQKRLESLSSLPTFAKKINSTTIAAIKILKAKKNQYVIRFQIFESITSPTISYLEETVSETSYDINAVKNEISQRFKILKMVDPFRDKVSDESGRIFFVCKRI